MKKETLFYLNFVKNIGWNYYKCKAVKAKKDKDGTQYYNIEYTDEIGGIHRIKDVPSRNLVSNSRTAWEYCFRFNDYGGYK